MPIKRIIRVLIVAGSAMVMAILLAKAWGKPMDAAVGYSSLLTAIAYELSFLNKTDGPS